MKQNINLAPFTYYKIGGPARYYAQPECIEDLKNISAFLTEHPMPCFILGAGSNLLIEDVGFKGLVIHTNKLNRALTHEGTTLTVGCSVLVPQILRYCGQHGLSGLECLVGVPGNCGGVLYMNAGTKAGEVKDTARTIKIFNLKDASERIYSHQELKYTYRAQHFLKDLDVIYEGVFELRQEEPAKVQAQIHAMMQSRKDTQPLDLPSCGSVFKNPDASQGLYAWKLIADAGLRGVQKGGAQISMKHTNFIVNLGGATAADVKFLIELAKKTVQEKFGVTLEEEVRIVGELQ